ncbi:unnamed protein product [Durusdinium trenchii]|uniref:J domain-containing protein n=1 Tax=Durusdinium trenchii TaxID=1381693 RepID=A0ABP0MEZ7_9DINO
MDVALRGLVLCLVTQTLGQQARLGFCPDGECINCRFCDGDCFASCRCETEMNTCCCTAPRGHYARGYEKVPCPGGTYQDQTGQNSCKPCSLDSSVLFDVNQRGAVDLVGCEEARLRCSSSCSNSTTCEVTCVSSITVETKMTSNPEDDEFCARTPQRAALGAPSSIRLLPGTPTTLVRTDPFAFASGGLFLHLGCKTLAARLPRPLYAVLGVAPDATAAEIKQAYRHLALQHHPDKCSRAQRIPEAETEALFARIALAYEVLGDEQRRRRYDLSGELPHNDAAAGRSAQETFLAAYMSTAPKTARAVTQADYSLHSLDNYEVLEALTQKRGDLPSVVALSRVA